MNRRSFLKSLVALTALTAVGHKASAQSNYIEDFRVTVGLARYSGPTMDALDGGVHHIALTRGQSGFRLYFDRLLVQDIAGIDVSLQEGVMSIVRDSLTPGEKPTTILGIPAVTSRRSILDYTLSSRQNLPSNENRVFGKSYELDELSARPELATAPLDLSGDFTIEFWVERPSSSPDQSSPIKATFDLSNRIPIKEAEFKTLFDPTLAEVEVAHSANPGVFIFIFLTCPIDEVGDWSALPISDYIVRPTYLGGIADADRVLIAQQIVRMSLGLDEYTL